MSPERTLVEVCPGEDVSGLLNRLEKKFQKAGLRREPWCREAFTLPSEKPRP
jgi:hypothetical protein